MARLKKCLQVFWILMFAATYLQAQSARSNEGADLINAPSAVIAIDQTPQTANQNQSRDVLPFNGDPHNTIGPHLVNHLVWDQKQFVVNGLTQWDAGKIKTAVPFAAFTGALIASDSWISKQVPDSHVTGSRTFSDYGVYSMAGATGGAWLLGKLTHNDHLRETGFLAGEAAIGSTADTYVLKLITQRQRPNEGNGNGNFFQGGRSFPSEHSVAAWSIASVVAHEYPGPLTKFFSYGLATAIMTARVTSKEHFASDVVVGSALGWYMGKVVYRGHHDPELGGEPWGETHWKEERTPQRNSMGSPDVPLDNWIYPAMERLVALGYISTAYAGQRPWTRLQCAQMLEEAEDNQVNNPATDNDAAQLYKVLAAEFAPETRRLNGKQSMNASLDSAYVNVTGISGPPLRDSFNFGQTIVNDFGRPYGEGANTYDGITAHADAGPLSIAVQAEYQHAQAVPAYSLSTQQAIAAANFSGVLTNAIPSLNRFQLVTGTVGLTWHNAKVSFGKQSLWWGPSESGALLMSDNAEAIPMFRIQNAEPFRIPFLSSLLGPLDVQFFLGQLSGHNWEVNSPNIVGPEISPQPFMHGEKLSFKPKKNLEFGMGVTAMFVGPGLPFTWSNFLRTYYVHSPNAEDNPGKRTSEFDVSYRIPNVATIYLDSMVVDEFSPIGSSRPTLNPGIYFPKLPKLQHVELRLEGLHEPLTTEFSPGFVYFDARRYLDGYTNNGLLMGSWIGRAGRGGQGWVTYNFSPRTKVEASYRHQEVSKDFIGGGRLVDYSMTGEALLSSSLTLSGSLTYEQWFFPVIAPDRKASTTASVQLTFWPHWNFSH
jgi:membrane-associated phospholipid phosphatase